MFYKVAIVLVLSLFTATLWASCPAGSVNCGGECVDLYTNNNHCGACSFACSQPPDMGERTPTNTCLNGQCTYFCPPHRSLCFGFCEDLATSTAHCGRCGNACAPNQVCHQGTCQAPGIVCGFGRCAPGQSCVNNRCETLRFITPTPIAPSLPPKYQPPTLAPQP